MRRIESEFVPPLWCITVILYETPTTIIPTQMLYSVIIILIIEHIIIK